MNKPTLAPRISVSTYVPLRPDPDGILSVEAVRRVRWNIPHNGRVVVSIYGLRDFSGEAASLIGRIVADAGATDVYIQASGNGRVVLRLREAVQVSANQYVQATT